MTFVQMVGHYAWAAVLWVWLAIGEIWEWVESWPATFVGVIVGSAFTLAGLVITNRNNLRNLRIQLEHNRDEKAKERAFAFRQGIYIGASEAITAGLSVLADAGNLSITEADLMKDFRAKNSLIGKVHMVATEPTAVLLLGFMRELSKSLIAMTLKRTELTTLQRNIDDRKTRIRAANEEIDRLIGMMKHHNIEGTMDERRLKMLQSNIDFLVKQRNDFEVASQALVEELRPKHMVFFDECQHEAVRVTQLLVPLVVSIRDELDLPVDEDVYRKAMLNEPVIDKPQLEQIFGMKMPEASRS